MMRKQQRNGIPASAQEAMLTIGSFNEDFDGLEAISPREFKELWQAIAFLYPGLSPDDALDHGNKVILYHVEPEDKRRSEADIRKCGGDPRWIFPYYERSGWPLDLEPVAEEAWRRFRNGEITEADLYPIAAQKAGLQPLR